jgi:hypothetical protein
MFKNVARLILGVVVLLATVAGCAHDKPNRVSTSDYPSSGASCH